MGGETDLQKMLATLEATCDGMRYGYGFLPDGTLPAGFVPLGTFRETEGLTVIAPEAELAAHGISHQPGWAMVSIRVHSALEAVGLTAAMAGALTDAGISANVVAACHHDHIFVPWKARDRAIAALHGLRGTA